MAFLARRTSLACLHNRHHPLPSLSPQLNSTTTTTTAYYLLLCLDPNRKTNRWLSTGTESTTSEFAGKNAYELLGVLETSSFAEIKASFRKLAKETHPDLAQSHSRASASDRFVRILAAYEILSDFEKRSHYDRYLLSQRMRVQRRPEQFSMMHTYETNRISVKQMEVVEWLKWYRYAINDILSEKRVVVGSGYFDILERDFYSAVHAAYYGPDIESVNLLPDCFEAEERSTCETPEVLHLVSGRDLFGMICLADKVPELSQSYNERITSFEATENLWIRSNSGVADVGVHGVQAKMNNYHASDAYKDLELHISGKMVAVATRVLPKRCSDGIRNEDSQDRIHVDLISQEDPIYTSKGSSIATTSVGSRLPLGTITGLGSNPEEGSCFVYDMNRTKTHVIMKHRTLLVKHMHWYQVGDRVSVAECRCSRARLPPSKFWLFEPRCGMHDIGGWYVETFGRDKKGRTVPSRRYWDGIDVDKQFDKRLHPAIYLFALAYRTLDLEDAKRRKQSMKDIVEGNLSGIISWCKKLG